MNTGKRLQALTMSPAYDALLASFKPAGWWKLGDAVGSTTAVDSSGNGNTLTRTATVTFGQASLLARSGSTAALFDGSTGKLATTGEPAILYGIPFTILCWVSFSSLSPSYSCPIGYDSINAGYAILVKSTGKLACYILGASSTTRNYDGTGIATLATTGKYMLAMSWDGTNLLGYVNGQADGFASGAPFMMVNPTAPFTIGTDPTTTGRYVNATMQESAYFPSILTQQQLQALYSAA